MNEPCECGPEPGWCPVFGREMSRREKQICCGVNCSEAVTKDYRKAWLQQFAETQNEESGSVITTIHPAGNKPVVTNVSAPRRPRSLLAEITVDDMPCEFRGDKLRDHKCAPCRGSVVTPVYECKHPDIKRNECSLATHVPGAMKCSSCQFGGEDLFESFMEKRQNGRRKSSGVSEGPLVPIPFTGPVKRVLLFYLWVNADIQRHAELLKKHASGYDRKIMCCAYNPDSDPIDVEGIFGKEWEHISIRNSEKIREVAGYRRLFPMVSNEDENTIITCAHAKGAQQHTRDNDVISWWTEAMYETVVGNCREIEDAFSKGYVIAGSFRRLGKHFGCKYRYHYSGTFYSLRASEFFRGGVPKMKDRYWGTESLPGETVPLNKSYCVFGDDIGDLYKIENQPRDGFLEWKSRTYGETQDA